MKKLAINTATGKIDFSENWLAEASQPKDVFEITVKEFRQHNKLETRAEFAKRCGVSVKTVQAWELGYRNPSKSALMLMMK